MDVDTYRYLFSALIQVFGALIAIGGIFIVWKFDIVQRRVEQLTKRLGVLVYFFENGIARKGERIIYGDALMKGEEFLTYEPKVITTYVNGTIEQMGKKISILKNKLKKSPNEYTSTAIEEEKNMERRLQKYASDYNHNLKLKVSIPKTIWIIMGIPALLVVILSVELVYAECIFTYSYEKYILVFSIILSMIGLYSLISISSKMMKED